MNISFNKLKTILKESLIREGGASGHMTHLFEDGSLTFGDLKQILKSLFSGKLRIEDEILSYNENTGLPEFKKIIDYSKNGTDDKWLEIKLSDGKSLICTPNHRIFLPEKGIDIKAEELKIGDSLIVNE